MKEEKGEGTLAGAGKGMFHPTVVCISWRLCLCLSQNQKHLKLTDTKFGIDDIQCYDYMTDVCPTSSFVKIGSVGTDG